MILSPLAKVPLVVFLNKCGNIGANPELLKKQFGTNPVWTVSALDRKQSIRALSNFVVTLPPHERKNNRS